VAYNGDILTLADFQKRRALFPGVSHWMLGRGALKDPFLAAEIKGIDICREERLRRLKSLHDQHFNIQAARFGRTNQLLDVMKALWNNLAFSFPDTEARLTELHRTKDYARYDEFVKSMFESYANAKI
jgi:tRNA-dihydrouridine synthase